VVGPKPSGPYTLTVALVIPSGEGLEQRNLGYFPHTKNGLRTHPAYGDAKTVVIRQIGPHQVTLAT
jgi:hypothetical protein